MPSSNKIIEQKCSSCGESFDIKYSTFLERNRRNYPNICPNCTSSRKANIIKRHYKEMSSCNKLKLSLNHKRSMDDYWKNIDDIEREKRSKSIKNYIKRLNKNDMQKRMINISNGNKRYWENLSKEKREELKQSRIHYLNKHFDNMKNDDVYRQSIVDKISAAQISYWKSKNEDEKKEILQNLFDGHDNWITNLSPDEYNTWRENVMHYWNTLSESERKLLSDRMSKTSSEYWKDLSKEDRCERIKKLVSSSNGHNNLHIRFEKQFSESYISNRFYYIPEVITGSDVIHSWDYGIYDKTNNTLLMVIDLDGAYYHADNCDYSGIRSHEEYDEKRFLSIPDEVMYHIIYENKFVKSFEDMIKILMVDYTEFLAEQFGICRMIEFPYPKYSEDELQKSFNQLISLKMDNKNLKLSTRNREGDRLITHFHPSIYHAHRYKCLSPYDAWYDDKMLMGVISNRIIYVNRLNPNKILQGFNISKVAPKVSVFSAGRAKILIHKYLHEFNEVFDPFSGFSGRMLGCISLNKRYIGQDVSDCHVNESKRILKFLDKEEMAEMSDQDILTSHGEYESLLTCPPYDDKEFWQNSNNMIKTCDDWIDECLKRFKCKRYVFVVDHTDKYIDNVVDEIVNKSHFGSNNEYVILIEGH